MYLVVLRFEEELDGGKRADSQGNTRQEEDLREGSMNRGKLALGPRVSAQAVWQELTTPTKWQCTAPRPTQPIDAHFQSPKDLCQTKRALRGTEQRRPTRSGPRRSLQGHGGAG